MAYDEGLAQRVRDVIDGRPGVVERKMFGGLAWFVGGNMGCGIYRDDLMVRLPPEEAASAWEQPGAGPFNPGGEGRKPMSGFVIVDASVVAEDAELASWVDDGLAFAASLPAK
jgi:TfoX/Sxy family transcriptional regulator of competence genes